MEQNVIKKVIQVEGMSCASCEMRIENALKKVEGVLSAKAIYSSSNVYVTYDANQVTLDTILSAIEQLDYKVKNKSADTDGLAPLNTGSKKTCHDNQAPGSWPHTTRRRASLRLEYNSRSRHGHNRHDHPRRSA